MIEYRNRKEEMGIGKFPHFIRVNLRHTARNELFSQATREVRAVRREHDAPEDVSAVIYGEKRSKILKSLSESPQTAKKLAKSSGLSSSAVYYFLKSLKSRNLVTRTGCGYALTGYDPGSLSLDEIVKIETDPVMRRRYGVSLKDLVLAYYLWDRFVEIAPESESYGKNYKNKYALAEAIHRWKTGRTYIPVWALNRLEDLSDRAISEEPRCVLQYHLPPGISVEPFYNGEYKLPVKVDSNLDKVAVQLLHRMSKHRLYTFPKKRIWLFQMLHDYFGKFDDSASRIPLVIIAILQSLYELETPKRSSARIPLRIRTKLSNLDPLSRIVEESSLLLHIISLSSQSNGRFEITSRSRSFLQDVATLASDIGLGALRVYKKHGRPHFRTYISEKKVAVLTKYARFFEQNPDIEKWMQIPLNRIAEKLIMRENDPESIELICYEELSRFIESILRSLERRKRGRFSSSRPDLMKYKEKVSNYFWLQKSIPSLRGTEELVEMEIAREENQLDVYARLPSDPPVAERKQPPVGLTI